MSVVAAFSAAAIEFSFASKVFSFGATADLRAGSTVVIGSVFWHERRRRRFGCLHDGQLRNLFFLEGDVLLTAAEGRQRKADQEVRDD